MLACFLKFFIDVKVSTKVSLFGWAPSIVSREKSSEKILCALTKGGRRLFATFVLTRRAFPETKLLKGAHHEQDPSRHCRPARRQQYLYVDPDRWLRLQHLRFQRPASPRQRRRRATLNGRRQGPLCCHARHVKGT